TKAWLWTFVAGLFTALAARGTRAATALTELLTVIETCRQQSRNVFAYVTVTVQAHFARQPMPSLLPESRTIDDSATHVLVYGSVGLERYFAHLRRPQRRPSRPAPAAPAGRRSIRRSRATLPSLRATSAALHLIRVGSGGPKKSAAAPSRGAVAAGVRNRGK